MVKKELSDIDILLICLINKDRRVHIKERKAKRERENKVKYEPEGPVNIAT
jgi:predicted nucleotidyltransferase